ncbi:MAG TPA: amidohydrolase [Sphingopyxis sp.]|nr:amidohydrolase [Sphingopyxis sp.]HMP45958.1 amidohydrolase [Sphingopyxis sp.]
MTRRLKGGLLAAASLTFAGCAPANGDVQSAGDKPAPAAKPVKFDKDPYPSTYRPYPGRVTAVRNVTIFDGEGGRIENGTILLVNGKVERIGGPDTPIPVDDVAVYDGTGKFVTPGIIDIHSHLGDYPSPGVEAHSDGNEATSPTTPEVWSEHSVWPQDPGFSRALANGGVTALQVLPGSANLMGGRSITLKNVPARTVQGMKFPGAPYGLKMACGENPKRVYGGKGRAPSTRMGNFAVNRQTWAKAAAHKKKMEEGKAERDFAMETLAGVLSGEILVHNHCYRADEMALVIDMSKEFGYKVSTFHHAVESYKIADLLAKEGICSAMWADWWGFKMEAYDSVPENVPLVHNAGACTIVHSDDANQIQRLNQEAAKALVAGRRMGLAISDEQAWTWLSWNPAKALGIADRTGSLKPGKMADVVLWNGHPFSAYTRPEKVWVDGALLYDANDPRRRPVSDFELGQPGEGDVK